MSSVDELAAPALALALQNTSSALPAVNAPLRAAVAGLLVAVLAELPPLSAMPSVADTTGVLVLAPVTAMTSMYARVEVLASVTVSVPVPLPPVRYHAQLWSALL